jgi:hypothetical protein
MATERKSWQAYVGDIFTLVPLLILAVFFFIGGVTTGGVAMTLVTAVLFWLTVLRRPEPVEPAPPDGPPPGA